MIEVNGSRIAGLEHAMLTTFGNATVIGTAEIAHTTAELVEDRFFTDGPVIPIIGTESSFIPPGKPGHSISSVLELHAMSPPRLISFGIDNPNHAWDKNNGTHFGTLLREWAKEEFLGIVVEKVFEEQRTTAVQELSEKVGGRAIKMSYSDTGLTIVTV